MYARVNPEWQGKHINSILTKKVFEYAESHNCPIVVLHTGPNNKHAITVYSHYGFKIVRFFHRKNKGFELAMVKYLNRDYCGFKVALVDLGIRVVLPFYRIARGCREILKRFF